MLGPQEQLKVRLAVAFEEVAGRPVDPAVRPSQHADFQSDAALALARTLNEAPRTIAERVVSRVDLSDLCRTVEISGPGFINLVLADGALTTLLAAMADDERLGVPRTERPQTIVIDYSAPNAAKEMHVGHLRSTIIGDAAVRLLEWQGHTVIRQNHIGEWGTPFGMLIEHLVEVGEAEAAHELSVGDLNGFYRAARRTFDTDEQFKQRARQRVVALQSGEATTRRLWHLLVDQSKKYFATVYARLGVRLTDDDYAGESFYNDQLESIVDELDSLGLLRTSEGATCAFPEGYVNRDGSPLPLIVRKTDGGFGYATTDLAAIRYRIRELQAHRLLYVIGMPQHQHVEMIFSTAREAGWLVPPVRAQHIGHGSVLGRDGKILASRAGAVVKLVDLLDEAVNRADAIIEEKNPDLDAPTRVALAHAVGIGAVKYADLSTDRLRDYVFDLDRMLSFDGNTAPYLQYARVRARSVVARAAQADATPATRAIHPAQPAERALTLTLLAFPDLVSDVAETLEFHRLANYLHRLAVSFTTFWEQCPVLKAEPKVRASRLGLCELTARTLATGLDLLGIEAPDRM